MKTNTLKIGIFTLLVCSCLQLHAGRIYDEFEDINKITWIGNLKIVSGATGDWALRAGDIYRLAIDNPSSYSYMVYEIPGNEIVHEVIVDFYSPTGLRPTLAVKNAAGVETKYVEGWDTGYPELSETGTNLHRFVLKDELIPDDATQVVVYLDAQSDVEIMRNVIYYGDGYTPIEYNSETNYYRVSRLMEKAENGENITIGTIGGSMTAGANAEPMVTNCYGARLKAWFESTYGIQVNLINIGIGSTNSYFGCIRAEEKLLRFNPDLITVEYACNDQLDDIYLDFYESLIRKCWKNPGEPAVISMMFCTQAGISKIDRQYPIAQHCRIPIVSYNDVVKDEIIAGGKSWLDYYQTSTLSGGDGIHPNTAAHQKIADLIAAELLDGKAAADAERMETLPAPLYSNILEDAYYLNETDITPVKTGNWIAGGTIWDFGTGKGWRGENANSELQFKINGDVAAVTYWKRPANENFGTAQVWVDNQEPVVVDGSNGEHIDQIVLTGLGAGEHTLHIKLMENKKFEVVCIAVSGKRSFWDGQYALENTANGLFLNLNGNNVTMDSNGTIFDVACTDDGYITFSNNGSYLSVNEKSGALEVSQQLNSASKFLYIDKGEKAAIRSVANGKYLSQKENNVTASASAITGSEYFLFKDKASGISKKAVSNIDCKVIANRIVISNASNCLCHIFDLSGRLLYRNTLSSDYAYIDVKGGNYLIQVGDKTFKCSL
mgnify:CR=1 FL=1